jgi:RNA polymerase sigma factor (sigma-70 family)
MQLHAAPPGTRSGRPPARLVAFPVYPLDGGMSDGPDNRPASGAFAEQARREAAAEAAGLIEAISARRDRAAFARLFADFAPRIKGYARRMGADGAVAEDLAQEVMLTVWRRAELFDGRKASASTWIFTIARNRRIDMLRRERRPEMDPNDPAVVPESDPPADHSVESSQSEARLHQAVARLPREQAELLRLAYFEDKSHSAIAEALDLPLGTVKSRIRLAMTKLRDMLKDLQ